MATSDIKKSPLYVDSTNNRVGIGTTSPSQLLSISDSGSARIEIISGTSGTSIIDMGDTADADIAGIRYAHNTNTLSFRSGNDVRMTISGDGEVLMPAQPSFLAYGSWSYDSSYYWKAFSTVDHNIGSHWNNTTGTWTCPIAGRYLVYATIYHDSTGNYHLWTFYKNNSTFAPWIQDHNQTTGENTTSSSAIINCAANDTLRFASHSSYANAYTGNYGNKVGVCLIH